MDFSNKLVHFRDLNNKLFHFVDLVINSSTLWTCPLYGFDYELVHFMNPSTL